ncbi:DUF2141 domain-containing protein [Roseateles sp. DC23W]|uniref:DUF2141 domain-containing protein n=1 Tax=Pelomonas dachongensis TaxID=3299029 RepID=A0ABW7EMA0_9BURK
MKRVLATALLACAAMHGHAADVTLEVEGLDVARLKGATLVVAVFTEPSTWLRQPQAAQRFMLGPDAAGGTLSIVLKDLPAGPLALSLFQDANANGRVDMNNMGIPTEPYGFSNNAVGNAGPPKFEQALMTPSAGQVMKIRMN